MKRRKLTVHEYLLITVPITVIVVIIALSTLISIFSGSFHTILQSTTKGLVRGLLIIVALLLLIMICMHKCKPLMDLVDYVLKVMKIERSLVSIGVYQDFNDILIQVPKVKINTANQTILIDISNPYFRSKLESYSSLFSSGLPLNWIIDNISLNEGQNQLIIEYFDVSNNSRKYIDSPKDYIELQQSLPIYQIKLMPNAIFDIKRTPHMLVTGTTNGGKSYFVLNNIISSAIIKGWTISILDYKGQYHILDGLCRTAYTVEEILEELRYIKTEMQKRKKALESVLKSEFSAVAYEHGFPIHLIVVEEYTALLTSGLKRETKTEIEETILNIAVLSRSLGFCLCLITQQSGSNAIPTSVRSQLQCRILLGSPSQSIYECTFEDKSSPKVTTALPIGCGLYSFDAVNVRLFRGYTFNYSISELFAVASLPSDTDDKKSPLTLCQTAFRDFPEQMGLSFAPEVAVAKNKKRRILCKK